MGTDTFVNWQFGMTLIVVLAVAIFLLMRVRRSQRKAGQEPGTVTDPKHPTSPTTGTTRH